MSVLAVNAGSSSLRLSLFVQTEDGLERLAGVHHSGIDIPDSSLLERFIASFDAVEITQVVHRVVHGGERFTMPCLIDAAVETEIERLIPLAPLHNSVALEWIRLARGLFGEQVPQVAVFDTAFYHSLPKVAATYALPRELCQELGIRRYGFHGIAHRAMLSRWQEIRPEVKDGGRVISVQLGSGCSITAINHGVPVDTSMGFSPLEGLLMATRSGDVDPMVVTCLQRQAGLNIEEVERLLNKQSGLLGVSGESHDMRVLLNSDSPDAELAVNLYCYRIRKYIGAYLAVLGGADAILFGGGVGENSPQVRAKILQGMEWSGVQLNLFDNDNAAGKEICISAVTGKTEVWVIPVDEAQVMALDAVTIMAGRGDSL
ncbi:MAG: acetate/propionate family kinase [Gammaproteobacteria bacterium]|nr:acetate/propionate family kinase [Gammaproteobacteria bacterium]